VVGGSEGGVLKARGERRVEINFWALRDSLSAVSKDEKGGWETPISLSTFFL